MSNESGSVLKCPLGPLIVGIPGSILDDAWRQLLAHRAVGGVILFTRNFESVDQLKALCRELRALRDPPLLIQVDQEGGPVQRFRNGFTPLPPVATLGRWYDSRPDRARDLAYRHGRVMAAEILDVGIDQSLAPVLDLGGVSTVIGSRAMSAHASVVADLGAHYLAGMRDAGMAGCGKHFPGHGSVAADSHDEVVSDPRSRSEMTEDLAPFSQLVSQLSSIMMAHVIYPAVDSVPAGFSARWIGDILRGELGFMGTIISDDLVMAGAGPGGSVALRLERCLEAGCDLALVCQPDSVRDLLAGLDSDWPDAGTAIDRLRGRAQFPLVEQLTVPEFQAWRESLGKLSDN